jgi:hypothetical protein
MKLKSSKPRNLLVPLVMKKTGAGKHKNLKKQMKQDGYREDSKHCY